MNLVSGPVSTRCADCGTEVAATLLVCPACRRLVHAATLKNLAAEAANATDAGDAHRALVAWRQSLELLPSDSRQHAAVAERIEALARSTEAGAPLLEAGPSGRWKWLVALGPAGLLIWKFKFLVLAILSKGKLLLLGLTKAGTLASMFAAVGLYWTQWGLWFALGLVASIYVHEMGHVAALRQYGIAASAPMFIPGFGALIRLKQAPVTPRESARIGLAGPVWGLGAAIAASLVGYFGGGDFWYAIGQTGAWINLFNMMPIWQLDGSRAFSSLSTLHRWIASASLALAWVITNDGVVLLVLLVAVGRALTGGRDVKNDPGALAIYVGVTLALAVVFYFARAAVG